MECPSPGSKVAEAARQIAQVSHGVNLDHRCNLSTCKFVVSPARLRRYGRPARLAVCKSGLHVHWCGNGVCQLAKSESLLKTDGPWVCPVSGLEVTGQAELYCPQRVRGKGSNPDTFVHSVSSLRRRSSSKKSRKSEIRRCLAILLNSKESETLILSTARRREKLVSSAVAKSGVNFLDQMKSARRIHPRGSLPAVTPAMMSSLTFAVDDFLLRVRHRLQVCKGIASQVAAVIGFLSSGVTSNGVVMFPKIEWVSERLPCAADLGKLPGFQCRPVSISARHIKAAVFGKHGTPVATLLFRWPN